MPNIIDQPWATGPREILNHAIGIMDEDSDTNRRLAMILTDNAVEQMIKTYLSLPQRITGLSIPRKRLDEISESFPLLLNTLEEFSKDKLVGVDLGLVEWYHRLRNELYHQGFGLTVEKHHLEIYEELANILYKNLFGTYLLQKPNDNQGILLERFIELWKRLEIAINELADPRLPEDKNIVSLADKTQFLNEVVIMPDEDRQQIINLQLLRNRVVHGEVDLKESITWEVIESLQRYVFKYEDVDHLIFG